MQLPRPRGSCPCAALRPIAWRPTRWRVENCARTRPGACDSSRATAAPRARVYPVRPTIVARERRGPASRVRHQRGDTPMPPTESLNSVDKVAELRQAALEYHEFPTPGKI